MKYMSACRLSLAIPGLVLLLLLSACMPAAETPSSSPALSPTAAIPSAPVPTPSPTPSPSAFSLSAETTPVVPEAAGRAGSGASLPDEVRQAAEVFVLSELDYWSHHTSFEGTETAIFNDWRIDSLEPIYQDADFCGVPLSVYRINYALHSTTPERIVLAGAPILTEDGWYTPSYAGCYYLVFLREEDELRYLDSFMINDAVPTDGAFEGAVLGTYLTNYPGLASPKTPGFDHSDMFDYAYEDGPENPVWNLLQGPIREYLNDWMDLKQSSPEVTLEAEPNSIDRVWKNISMSGGKTAHFYRLDFRFQLTPAQKLSLEDAERLNTYDSYQWQRQEGWYTFGSFSPAPYFIVICAEDGSLSYGGTFALDKRPYLDVPAVLAWRDGYEDWSSAPVEALLDRIRQVFQSAYPGQNPGRLYTHALLPQGEYQGILENPVQVVRLDCYFAPMDWAPAEALNSYGWLVPADSPYYLAAERNGDGYIYRGAFSSDAEKGSEQWLADLRAAIT